MSAPLDEILRAEMARWESAGLRRDVDAQSESSRSPVALQCEFTSNDYLSLARDPRLIEAARRALDQFGVGGRAARLLGGGCDLDRRAEESVAEWLDAEAALLFPSGYQANSGVLAALAERGDAIFSDELNHASIIDAARLARAQVLVYRHRDLEHLAAQLVLARGARRRFVVTETVFSMDGDLAPLAGLNELCARHDAHLVLDEAHGVGLLGREGAGAWIDSSHAKDSRLAARIVTGGKALGVSGAFVVGSRGLRDHLANRARSFVFTTAVSPAISGALCAAIDIARAARTPATAALSTARRIAAALDLPTPAAAIVPFVVGASDAAMNMSRDLRRSGFDVRAVRPPTVPEDTARLRIACHAHNDDDAVRALVDALRTKPLARRERIEPQPRARVVCVVGTDTDVGKTVVSALLARALLRHGAATYWKPVQTGDVSDTREVERLAGSGLVLAEPLYEFALPASPHTAAAAAESRIDFDALCTRIGSLRRECTGALVIELAGGLLVPYDDDHTQADLLARERPQVVLVARSGLGTLNHTLLTLEALASRGLTPRALFLVGAKRAENAATLRARSGIEHVHELEPLEPLNASAIDAWLGRNDVDWLRT